MEQMKWKNILMEDILRLAKEKGSSPTFNDVMEDSRVTKEEVGEAVVELERKNLAKREGEKIVLTEEGEKIAEIIYNYHKTVEKLFGHRTAHSFEHMADRVRYLENVKNSKPLITFGEGEEGVIVSMEFENPKIIARLIGIGLVPGAHFKVIKVREDIFVLNISGRLVIVDGKLTKNLLGVKPFESSFSRST